MLPWPIFCCQYVWIPKNHRCKCCSQHYDQYGQHRTTRGHHHSESPEKTTEQFSGSDDCCESVRIFFLSPQLQLRIGREGVLRSVRRPFILVSPITRLCIFPTMLTVTMAATLRSYNNVAMYRYIKHEH